tara:strand:+ start:496 stop:798 length:303 start_codon:yes stop_codon:yes gene_type:complete
MKRRSGTRASYGEIEIHHKGKVLKTSVGSTSYEDFFAGEAGLRNFRNINGNIPLGYEHRPDLISNLFLESPLSWWVICERNAIFDVFEQLKAGEAIRLPL